MKFLKSLFSKIKSGAKRDPAKGKSQTAPIPGSETATGQSQPDEQLSPYTQTNVTKIADEEDTLVTKRQSAEKAPASLLLLNGPQELMGLFWPLNQPVTSVGRSSRLNDIIIPHNSLSKTHFQIIKEKQMFYIVDLRSTNKTYINDKQIEPYQKTALENNSYIRASHLIFKFLDKGNIEILPSKQILSATHTDSLTGAGNRRLLKVKGPEYFFSNQVLSLIVFDIDKFKMINDNFGHTAGDYILKTLSRHVLKIIRKEDMFIRYGGDEFCIFTPNPRSSAKSIAERMERQIQANQFIFKGQKISLSLSIGIAEKSPSDKAWEDIYQRADKESYEQKRKKKAGPN